MNNERIYPDEIDLEAATRTEQGITEPPHKENMEEAARILLAAASILEDPGPHVSFARRHAMALALEALHVLYSNNPERQTS
ncbi:MAG: hypothetical protein PVI21_06555 [Candidatus Woesebacteria bacterium]|jgi:hypothetical protein